MSYCVHFAIDTGGEEPADVGARFNYTWNCAPMFSSALGRDEGINWLHGKIAGDVIAQLERAVSHIRHPANRAMYQAMNPANGWGNHSGAAEFLEDILRECRRHPKTRIVVS